MTKDICQFSHALTLEFRGCFLPGKKSTTHRVVDVEILGQRVAAIAGHATRAVVCLERTGRHGDFFFTG